MNKISFVSIYREELSQKEKEVTFDLSIIRQGTTTVIFGQMIEDCYGKTSVAGCSILSPEDTYNELTGVKIAFKNLLSDTLFFDCEAKQLYSEFRKLLYLLPVNTLIKLESIKV